MALGVQEPRPKGQKVPGTVYVERETEELRHLTANLKHGTGRDENIVLVPQPSDSPNDPLNWPYKKKVFVSWMLSIGAGLASGTSQFLNPAHTKISKLIGAPLVQLSRSSSIMVLCLGIAAILTSPLARIYGKRPVLLVSSIVALVGYGVLLAHPTDIKYIWAGRAIWGAASSALEYLVSSSVGDLFFVHQRSFHLSVWHVALSAGNSIGQVIAAQIVSGQNYEWAFRYAEIFMAVYTVFLYFLVPETAFNRSSKFDNDVQEVLAEDLNSQGASSDQEEKGAPSAPAEKATGNLDVVERSRMPEQEQPETYVQSLRLYRGRFSNENYFRAVLSPFATLLLPAVAWAAYTYAVAVAFSIAMSVSLSSIFTAAPYNFTTSQVGLVVLSPFVGDILGNVIFGPIADWTVVAMSRRNNGVFEPEFRNILYFPALFTGLAGYWGFGLSIHYRIHWFAPVFFFGLAGFAGQVSSLISNTYLLDCHRKCAQDGYAITTLMKGVLTFVVGYFVNQWLAQSGPIQVFFLIGMIHGIGCVGGLLLYVYGKRLRLAVHHSKFINNALRWCGNRD